MNPRLRVVAGALLFFVCGISNQKAQSPVDPDKDPAMEELLQDARALVDAKKPQAAIEKCETVISHFKTHYGKSKSKIYCARGSTETVAYLIEAAAKMSKGEFDAGKKNAIVLSSVWASAYFFKGYALQDLGRIADAKAAIQQAIALSPWNSRYLSELGSLYVREKDWAKAMDVFEKAEDQAPVSDDEERAEVLARARRGLGYVYVELGQLSKAQKKYEQCLAEDPNDTRAARELEYVRGLMAKTKNSQSKP